MTQFDRWYSSTMRVHWTREAPRQGKTIKTKIKPIFAKCRRMTPVVQRLKVANSWLVRTDQHAPSSYIERLRILLGARSSIGMLNGPRCMSRKRYDIRIYPGVSSSFYTVVRDPSATIIKGSHHPKIEAALQAAYAIEGMPIGQPVYIYSHSLPDLMADDGVPAFGGTLEGGAQ